MRQLLLSRHKARNFARAFRADERMHWAGEAAAGHSADGVVAPDGRQLQIQFSNRNVGFVIHGFFSARSTTQLGRTALFALSIAASDPARINWTRLQGKEKLTKVKLFLSEFLRKPEISSPGAFALPSESPAVIQPAGTVHWPPASRRG